MKIAVPLYILILLALLLGAIFGAIFPVDKNKFKIITYENKKEHELIIQDWSKIESYIYDSSSSIHLHKTFKVNEQIQIIKYFSFLTESEKQSLVLKVYNDKTEEYKNIISIDKIPSIASAIKPIGDLFIRLLSFLAIPLVLASLLVGAASLEDVKKFGRIGLKTLGLYIITTLIAITIGLLVANIIQPGTRLSEQSKTNLLNQYQNITIDNITKIQDIDIVKFFVEIVPTNPFKAIAEGQMLQIIFFAIVLGLILTIIDKTKAATVIKFFEGLSEAMIKLVGFVMLFAPLGVFALIASTIAEFGFDIITTLFWYMSTVLLGLFIHTILIYPLIVSILGRTNPITFFKSIAPAQAVAFSTSSSAATLPVTFDCVENRLGIPKYISSFVLPLGATINMDGTALYQGVAAVFIAQVYGIDLNLIQQLTIIITAVLASIGTAPVPGVGIIMLVMILQSVHIPPEGIALIIGVDRFLDMCRTIPNITGDASVAVAIYNSERKYNRIMP